MAQFLVRNLDDDVRDKLRELASRQGRSMEETVRDILRNAVVAQSGSQAGLGTRLAKRFAAHKLKAEILELHGQFLESMQAGYSSRGI
ncbi:FitA-like ribbon-helix-helix domain-containing protein [Planctomicrobium piriforme]|uniref:Ribbon-helix-helix protein, copG family n=1 Tax=Planctomicrobium piriforme TaxID=1576369 RepID=A0A1I3IE40_9PLAN|nr:ribbon-helix-helix protein, CopG family [Planctomicrobium piriforme]SFI46129.1 Ribbon-helix-helix protein, copG family [Planctomicrobium piriforme]